MDGRDLRDDGELFAAARAGEFTAWTALCRRQAAQLAAYLGARLRRPEVVDQLVGESIVVAWQRLPELVDPSGFAAWFRRIGGGLALRWAHEHPTEPIDAPWPATRAADADVARLDAVIGSLDEAMRMALELRWRAGLAGRELAVALRCSPEEAERQADAAESELLRRWPSE